MAIPVIYQNKAETLLERLFGEKFRAPKFIFFSGNTPVIIHPTSGPGLVQPGSSTALEATPAESLEASS